MKTKTIIITMPGGRGGLALAGGQPRPAILAAPLRQPPPTVARLASVTQPRVTGHLQASAITATQPRKRERLTHLSAEEKLNRRKLKNRIAAQTARDRKKLKMASLEEVTGDMQAENEALGAENEVLRSRNLELEAENARLRAQLEETSGAGRDVTLGSAASISAPLPREQVSQSQTLLSLLTTLLTLSSASSWTTTGPRWTAASASRPSRPQLEEMQQTLLKGHSLSTQQLQQLRSLTHSLWSKGRLKQEP